MHEAVRALRQLRTRLRLRQGPEFASAYNRILAARLPLMYAITLVELVELSVTFHASAPPMLALWIPMALAAALLHRMIHWLPSKVARRSDGDRARDLKRLARVGPVIAFALNLWALALYPYGTLSQQSLIHYAVAITTFSAILVLSPAPLAALRLAVGVCITSGAFFLANSHPNAMAVVTLQIVLSALLLAITISHHRDFVRLELSRQKLARREHQASELAEANRRQAVVDPLTGIANRRALLGVLEVMLSSGGTPWLALLDLDGFKPINDTYGHRCGDEVLCAVAERIAATPRVLAAGRLGGDEFAVLLPGDLTPAETRATLIDLAARLRVPIDCAGASLRVSCSAGYHRISAGTGVIDALERADAALYKAKETVGAVSKFTAKDERVLGERRAITRIFHSADLERQISVVYQPIVDAESGRPVAFEALARWTPDGKRWLLPGRFVQIAEATGRIAELTQAVLNKALVECPAWEFGARLTINLSARDLLRDNAARTISDIVAEHRAPPESIVLEITETALLTDYDRAHAHVVALRDHGFLVALDDFGTGQSSLSHVHRLPLDYLKIDRTFARDLATDPGARAITATIVTLAHQLGLACAIEGIEQVEQQVVARALGLQLMQGYLFGRPAPAAVALGMLRQAA